MDETICRDDARAGEAGSKAGVGWWVFTVLACAHFTYRYVLLNPPFVNLAAYAHGRERMPYQGRVLMAWVLHGVADNPRLVSPIKILGEYLRVQIRDPYRLVLLPVSFVSILLATIAGRLLLEELTADARFAAWASLLTLYMTYFNLIVGYGLFGLPYDVPSLAVFMTAMWLIVSKRGWWLVPLVALGSLNRETVIFVPIISLLYSWFSLERRPIPGRSRLRRLLPASPSLLLQVAVWGAIRVWLSHAFRNNPNETVIFHLSAPGHLRSNLASLIKPPQWPLFLSLFGFTLPLLASRHRLISHAPLRRTAPIVLALWLSAMLIVGVIVEIRVFNEMTAIVMPCIAMIIWSELRTDRPRLPREPPGGGAPGPQLN